MTEKSVSIQMIQSGRYDVTLLQDHPTLQDKENGHESGNPRRKPD